jgi:pyruvate formate lyase activating enzyme
MAAGELGFCGLRENTGGRVHSRAGTSRLGLFNAYHDPLPTNCVADWVCPAGAGCGNPEYSLSEGPEVGFKNLAVFLAACSFDCAFCQNWTFREETESLSPLRAPIDLEAMVDSKTTCVCYFGGDPSPQMPFALAASRLALKRASQRSQGRILRICWETNGSMNPGLLKKALELSLETGGCIKFDLKAMDGHLHRALTGVDNRRTLENFELAVRLSVCRPDPPPVVASTLMVPGYVGAEEVGAIARFIASHDPDIPYSLLAFYPEFLMGDMGTTTLAWAEACANAARDAGLRRVKIGNLHLLS